MKLQIDQNWQSDSILFAFIQNKIINKNLSDKFRENYLSALKNNDENYMKMVIEDFKENVSLFVFDTISYKSEIDFNLFIEYIEKIENYYKNTISWEFYYFRYYQYLTFLYSFIFFCLKDEIWFKEDYLKYIKNNILKRWTDFDINTQLENDFNRLGYWMATWSGKTILMYATIYMYLLIQSKNTRAKIKDLYIVVPSDELRKQHKEFLEKFNSNLFGRINDKWTIIDFENIKLFWDYEVDWKLTTINWISWQSLPSNAILLIDEAHKWAWLDSNKETWLENTKTKFLRQQNTFMFEYSATFQKAFEKELDDTNNILNSYILSSVYKYNLYNFNVDWFWKNYHIEALKKWDDTKILILRSLVNYYNQLNEYKYKEELTKRAWTWWLKKWAYLENRWQRVYKPLYVWLSYKLDNDPTKKEWIESETSLKDILKNIIYIFNNLEEYNEELVNLWVDKPKFYEIFTWKKYIDTNSKVNFTIFYDKTNDEIRINIENNLMIINTGQNKKIAESLLADDALWIYANNNLLVQEKLFSNIDKNENILFLFGSRKFVEWWDSKRPSTILLFKMWKTGTIISTQILWRWIRLYWTKWDWFRHLGAKYLENINIFGYDIDEFNSFIESLSDELYKIVIFKKKQFSKHFLDYANKRLDLWSDEKDNDKKIEKLFWNYFKLIEEKLNKQKQEIKDIKVLEINVDDNKLRFLYEWEQVSYIVNNHEFISNINSSNLEEWKNSSSNIINKAFDYRLWYISINDESWLFNDETLEILIKKYFEDKKFRISDKSYDDFFNFIKFINIKTDKFNHWFDDIFDLDKQEYKNNFFIDKLYSILDKVSNNLTNTLTTWISHNITNLKLSNLVDEITLTCKLEQTRDKEIINTFFWDSSKMILEKNFDDLSKEQQKLVITYFEQNNEKDLHIYDRLFYIDTKGQVNTINNFHEVNNDLFKDYDISPSELKLNWNEEWKISRILNSISRNSDITNNYDVFYLRNIRWKQWSFLYYEDRSWNYAKVYPDFIFWFVNKHNEKDITLIYYEPKWESIDVNDKQKREKLEEISIWDVDKNICALFGLKENYNSGSLSNLKIMGILEK